MEYTVPTWDFRSDVARQYGFGDLIRLCAAQYRVYESAYNFVGPYNARQRNSMLPYAAPERAVLLECIQRRSLNEIVYLGLIGSLIRFCENTRGLRALPTPHPSVISSIQFPEGTFEFSKNGAVLEVSGADEPINIRAPIKNYQTVKHVILRAKLSKLGTPSASNWEVLGFKRSFGFIPDWTDSIVNPRYVGQL